MSIKSTTDIKLEKLRKKEDRKVGRRIAQGQGEPLLEWLAESGVGFAAICEAGLGRYHSSRHTTHLEPSILELSSSL